MLKRFGIIIYATKFPTNRSTQGKRKLRFGRMLKICKLLLRSLSYCFGTKRIPFLYWERTQENQYSITITPIGFVLSKPELKRNSIRFAWLKKIQDTEKPKRISNFCFIQNLLRLHKLWPRKNQNFDFLKIFWKKTTPSSLKFWFQSFKQVVVKLPCMSGNAHFFHTN